MWKKIQSLFSSRSVSGQPKLPGNFENSVRLAISAMQTDVDLSTDEQFLEFLETHDISHTAAVEILIFLPIAFVRHWLADANWPETYFEYLSANKTVERRYHDTESYQVIWRVTAEYYQQQPDRKTILKIAGRSAELNAINDLLHDNPGTKLQEIQIAPSVISR